MTISLGNDGHGWSELLPARQPRPSLTDNKSCDFAVIGAGFTGLACARRLAELHPDKRIALIEGRAVGDAASGRNSGYAVGCSHFPGAFDPGQRHQYERINRINASGLGILRQQVSELGIHCQWHEKGIYHPAADQQSIREVDYFADYLNRLDIPHERLDRAQLHDQLGTSWYAAGIHVAVGALVQPAMLVRGLADSLPTNVELFENTTVLGLQKAGSYQLQLALGGKIQADKVMLCTNFEAKNLGYLKHSVVGSTLSGSFTRKLEQQELASLGDQKQWGILSLHSGGATVRLTEDGRLSVRNTAEYHGGRLLSEQTLKQRQGIHRQAFENRFPQLQHVEFEYAWSGVEGISWNGTNFFRQETPGLYLAGGYNGSGVSRGTAFGTALADYASDQPSQLVSDCLDSPAARWLPPRPLLDVGAWFTVRKRFRGVGRDR